jgi:NAD+ synthase (glutamine-hydrolysing)
MTLKTQEISLRDFAAQLLTPQAMRASPLGHNSFVIPGTERSVEIREIESAPGKISGAPDLKVAYAQIKTEPGDFVVNTTAHIEAMRAAHERGVHLLQFPEMSLPNYCSLDLLLDTTYLKAQELWLNEIVEFSKETPGLTTAVGYVDVDWDKTRAGDRPYSRNSLAIIRDGKIIEVVHKKLLPNYSVFDEVRWYEPGKTTSVVDINGVKVGFLICEDIWTDGYEVNPVQDLIDQGAEFLTHSAASPFHIGKNATRAALVEKITDTHKVPFGSVNMVGTFDGYEGDLPFDGRGLVRSKDGEWLAMGTPYKEELLILNPFAAPEQRIPELMPMQELLMSLVDSIYSYFKRLDAATGSKNCAVIGNSGGIDSALAIALCSLAIGPDRVKAISLPTKFNSAATKGDAQLLADNFKVESREVPIQAMYDTAKESLAEAIRLDPTSDCRVSQNLQARLRTMALMAYAQALGGVMINTSNKTERWTNNFTIYADSAGVMGPIADVDKDRVYELSRYLNELFVELDGAPKIPQSIIDREASAELDFNQVDANVMGDKPEVVAPHLREIIEGGLNDFTSARAKLPATVPDTLIKRWMGQISASEWKGRQIPPGTRITPLAHGFNRRIPINHKWRGQTPQGGQLAR